MVSGVDGDEAVKKTIWKIANKEFIEMRREVRFGFQKLTMNIEFRQKHRFNFFTALVLCGILNAFAAAQSATASLSGTVVDENGAVVAGATVKITDAARAFERLATTNDDGFFTFVQLQPAAYVVKTERSGFAASEIKNLVLNVGDQRSLQIVLRAGDVSATVTVDSEPPLIDESPAVATTVDRQFVENQPLNGRSFQTLVELSPGVVLTPTNVTNQGQFSVNGQRTDTNYFTIDGVSANFGVNASATLYQSAGGALPAYSALGGTNNLASVDAVQEFTIQTSTYAAEFGRQPGAQVQIVTRSGTNQYRGSVFNYLRNDVFDANDYSANRNGLKKPALRQNDFGFTLGGPLPFLNFGEGVPVFSSGKDRTFFFVSYEGLRLRQPVTSSPIPVPSLAARAAATGFVRALFNLFPQPNGATLAGDPNTATFTTTYSNPASLDATSVRIDHKANDRLTFFGRFNYAPSEQQIRANFSTPNTIEIAPYKTVTFTVGSTQIFSPRVSNDLRVNYSRAEAGTTYTPDNLGGAAPFNLGDFIPAFSSPASQLANLTVGGQSVTLGFNGANQQRQFNIVDALSVTTGTHALKFGADYRRLNPIQRGAGSRLFLTFTSATQALTTNTIPALTLIGGDVVLYPQYDNFSAFAQDTWRATNRLTVSYGIRYEVAPSPKERDNNLPFTVRNLENLSALSIQPPGSRLYETTFNNFAPRVGAAYRIFDKTVIRGGFGVFYDLGYNFAGSAFSNSIYPFSATRSLPNTPVASLGAIQFPTPNLNPPFGRLFAYETDFKLPYTLQYNASVEQSIGANGAFSVSYVGARGKRLGRVVSLRNPAAGLPSIFTRIDAVYNDADSQYDALQAQYQQRFARGLQVLSSYTFGKSLDTVSNEAIINFQAPLTRVSADQERGASDFDVRHSFSAAVSYEIPSPFKSGIGQAIFGGFGIDGIYRGRTATPVNILTGQDVFGVGSTAVSRPDLIAGQPLYIDDQAVAGGRRFNPAAFNRTAPIAAGRQGTFGRNVLRGFGVSQLDLSLRRQFSFTERLNLQARVDAFNVFNRPNFANPSGILTDINFGRSTQMLGRSIGSGGGFNPLYQIGGPRSLQLSLKLNF
jgi:hypothetical protein